MLGICGARQQNAFRELRIFSGIWEDQCIILREQASTNTHPMRASAKFY